MNTRPIRIFGTIALLASLALPAYTCTVYIDPAGQTVNNIPPHADTALYRPKTINHYPLEHTSIRTSDFWVTLVIFAWSVPFLIYRLSRRSAKVSWWLSAAEALLALGSGYVVYVLGSLGEIAVGTYLALTANFLLLSCCLAEIGTTWRRARLARG